MKENGTGATEQRLVDANRISYHPSGFPKGDGFDSRLDWAFREDIDKAPTVDAVEVVRCKDCEHSEPCICVVCEEGNTMVCRRFLSHVQKDHFCSYGERRTDA